MSVLQIRTENGVRVLTLNRPEKLNAFNDELSNALEQAVEEANHDDDVRVVVLTGSGKGFSSGLDLSEVAKKGPAGLRGRSMLVDDLGWVGRLALGIANNDKPFIAAINGTAAGAGFALTLACDFRFMSDGTKVTTGYIRRGLNPDAGMTYFLPKLVGHTRATELILTGRDIYPEEAENIGLVTDVFPADEFMDRVMAFATQIAEGPPIAMTFSKRLLTASHEQSLEAILKQELASIKVCFQTEDVMEGVAAFAQKRKPVFKGK